ncbi:hypothetical protein ACRCPG_29485, partial [Pseudomonas aeruginosa]
IIEQKQLNTWVSFQSAEQPLLGQFSVSGNNKVLEIEHHPELFSNLIQLRAEVLASMKKKKALNSRPLLSRCRFSLPFKLERF